MIVQIGDRTAIASVCDRLGEHLWCCIEDKTACAVCGAIKLEARGFASVFLMYEFYLRGLVADEQPEQEAQP